LGFIIYRECITYLKPFHRHTTASPILEWLSDLLFKLWPIIQGLDSQKFDKRIQLLHIILPEICDEGKEEVISINEMKQTWVFLSGTTEISLRDRNMQVRIWWFDS
jgi:hypothetical protein